MLSCSRASAGVSGTLSRRIEHAHIPLGHSQRHVLGCQDADVEVGSNSLESARTRVHEERPVLVVGHVKAGFSVGNNTSRTPGRSTQDPGIRVESERVLSSGSGISRRSPTAVE